MKILQRIAQTLLKRVSIKTLAVSAMLMLVVLGCTDSSSNLTQPETDSESTASEEETEEQTDEESTSESSDDSCDNFADNREDDDLPILSIDGTPVTVSMECAGDVDWYLIELEDSPVQLEILLSDIDEGSDFDLKLYDAEFVQLEDGRSAESGSNDEELSLEVDGSEFYLEVYAFSGRGDATLEATAEQQNEDVDDTEDDAEDSEDDDDDEAEEEEEVVEQLTDEELLDTTFWFYPRGDSSDLLERSVETRVEESIYCSLSDASMWGELTIVNFAHVERDLLEYTDYIDGWALVVFNGSKSVLEQLEITIQVSILASELDVEVETPVEMTLHGDEYIISKSREGVYYLSQSYGDLSAKSDDDLKVSSGVIGEMSSTIFEQNVEVEWLVEDNEGAICSGQASGDAIADFELANYLNSLQPH